MEIVELINENKIKRFFQVRNKLIYPEGLYHITQRATGKELLFIENFDYLYMLRLIKEKSQKFYLKIFAFCLIPNHLHLLLKIHEPNLSKAMKNLFETYADFFNDKYERKGTLFCGRYRLTHCLNENYLLVSSLYIHLNPVRAGLVNNPEDYRWSSCKMYTTLDDKKTFLDYKFILKILDDNLTEAKKKYRRLLDEGRKIKTKDILESPKSLKYFWQGLFKVISNLFNERKEKSILFSEEDEGNIIKELMEKKRLRKPQEKEGKRFLIQQLISRGYKISEIAERIGQSRQSIYQILNLTK